jgi:hypothetical protein
MVLTEGPIYRLLATSGSAEKSSKMNFATEPPGTLLSDQFNGDWETYLISIESASPVVEALGVTDYFSIQTYRKAKECKAAGRMPAVKLLFPNVEMRVDIKTAKSKGINLHLLFSPEDPKHEQEIERILSLLEFEFDERPYR